MSNKRRVALMIETSSGYGRELLKGVARFMQTADDWSVFVEQRDLTSKLPSWLDDWDGHGIISRATTPKLAGLVKKNAIPMIELTDRRSDLGGVHVRSDDVEIGRLGFGHLQDRGFQNFAFCGFRSEAWSERRQRAFVDALREKGYTCPVYNSPWHGVSARPWGDEQRRLSDWVAELDKPVGVMACNDLRGLHVLEACALTHLDVPEQVAVLGVDDDSLVCQLCDPPLSSVVPNAEGVGYTAASLLARWMSGEDVQDVERRVAPRGVATRLSTDIVAVDDLGVAAALTYIRKNACRGINVADVVKNTSVSRSTLERKLRQMFQRSPQQEIRVAQLKRVRQLLTDTELPIERIAHLCGFEHTEYLHVVFKREEGMTPGAFRRAAKRNRC